MSKLDHFAITKRWTPKHPDLLQLYSIASPNGVKVSIALEELELRYEVHRVDIGVGANWSDAFLSLNPNGKIPAIIDPNGPGGVPIAIWESCAILVYLAEKTSRLLSADAGERYETLQWTFFQAAALGPMFGQLGYFHKFAGREINDKRPLERYRVESKRLLGVLERRLAGRLWLVGSQFSIADIACIGWVRNLVGFYEAGELVGFGELEHVPAWLERALARPAVQRGLTVPR